MMKSKIYIKLGLFLSAALVAVSGYAQTDSTQNNEPMDLGEVISIGSRNLTLKDAYKHSSTPVSRDSSFEMSGLDFMVSPLKASTSFTVDALQPANLRIVDQLPKYYRAYVLGGFGSYSSPRAELYFNSLRSRDWNYGIEAKHFSGQGGINDVPSSAWGDTKVGIYANRYLKKSSLGFRANYRNDRLHYYGGLQEQDSIYSQEDIEQKVNRIHFEATSRSFFKDTSRINYLVNLSYDYLNDRFNSDEHRVKVDAHILGVNMNQYYDLGIIIDHNSFGSNPFTLGVGTDSLDLSTSQNNTLVGINPAVDMHGDKWKILAGVNMYFNGDRFHFYPRAEAYYELFDKLFIPYLGLNGEMQKRTFGIFFDENPFVISSANLKNRNQKFNLYLGIRGKITPKISFDIKLSHEQVDDQALFVNDTLYSAENRFNIRYDNVRTNSAHGNIKYALQDKIDVGLGLSLFSYSTSNELFAWHLPDMRGELTFDYKVGNKFLLGLDLYYMGKRKAASFYPVEGITPNRGIYAVDLDAYVDANLRFEYRYTQRLSAFLTINNLLSSKYETWYKYQAQPFFIMIGASYSF